LREFSTATQDGQLVIQAHPDPVVVYPAKDFWLLVVESERGHLRRFTKHSEFQDDDELSAWVLATLEGLGITPRRLDWGDEFQDAWVALDEFEARLERTDWLGHPAINQILNDAAREIRDHLRRPVTQGARERIPHVLVEAEAKVT